MTQEYENYTPEIPSSPSKESQRTSGPTPRNGGVVTRNSTGRNSRTHEKPAKPKKDSGKKPQEKKEQSPSFLSKIKPWCTANNLHLVLGIVLGAIGIYLAVAFVGYFTSCIKDQPLIHNVPVGQAGGVSNPGGEGGARLAEFLINECFGLGSFVIILWLLALSLRRLTGWPRFRPVNFTIKCLVALITVSLIIGLVTYSTHSPVNWGGYHGRYVNRLVIDFIGWYGGIILCVAWVAIFIVFCLRDLINWIVRKKKERDERLAAEAAIRAEEERQKRELERMRQQEAADLRAAGEAVSSVEDPSEEEDEEPVNFENRGGVDAERRTDRHHVINDEEELGVYSLPEEYEPDPIQVSSENRTSDRKTTAEPGSEAGGEPSPSSTHADLTKNEDMPSDMADNLSNSENAVKPDNTTNAETQSNADNTASAVSDEKSAEKENLSSAVDPQGSESQKDADPTMIINVNQIEQSDVNSPSTEDSIISYPFEFPTVDLLRPGVEKISVDTTEQAENKERIRKTLLDFGIPITDIEATVGPTVTLYEIKPDTGVKIAKIRNLVDDIALSLAAIGVRIIAPIPGKGTVGIEVANKDPQIVSMRTVIQSKKFRETKAKLPVALGCTISNEVYVSDLAKMPHLLVAGATGQGKSVGLNAIIASLLYSKRPEELKFVMIDPKRVEFSLYSMIESHYLAKIPGADEAIITGKKVVPTLSSLCVEMENRYDLLKSACVRNIEEYNAKFKSGRLNLLEGHRFLPYIVVIIDEFSDLIMTAGKEVETPIARLAQMARAVGMHVIIATQRPSTNVITGVIKANFPVRIAFKVSSGVDSKTILDTTGAQQLIGRGDMLISINSEMIRVQCAFIDTPEVEKICEYVMKQPYGKGAYLLPEPLSGDEGESSGDGFGGPSFGDRDPLFAECARYVVMSRTGSASSLQRRYSIGYNRAGKIMDQLEALGIVGPSTGGKARDVLVDSITLERMLEENSL